MHSIFTQILFLTFLLISLIACKSTKLSVTPDADTKQEKTTIENLDIYLLIGQSNMAGRAELEIQDKDTLENVLLYTGIIDNEWIKAANPLNKYSTIRKDISMQRLGPGYTFAEYLAEQNSGKQIGLVVNARGGTNISAWAQGTEYYNEAVKRTKEALKYGTLKGIAWHQGEGDVSRFESYTPKIIALIEALRNEFNIPDLPVVVGQLSEDKEKRIDFNEMIIQLPEKIDKVAVVTTENTTTTDSTHFDARSQRLIGERYAMEMLKLLSK